MSTRRFNEDEAREIFERAARAEPTMSTPPESSGLSLEELQEIGAEVGLSRDAIASAARSLTALQDGGTIEHLGIPVGVSRSVALGRTVSDAEWGRLVGRLRRTFRASGNTEEAGTFREWWNGNLRITVERTDTGDVLHMFTQKSGAREASLMGALMLTFAAGVALMFALTGRFAADPGTIMIPLMLGGGGLGVLAANTVRLRGWFARRRDQFEALARSVLAGEVGGPALDGPPASDALPNPEG